MESNEQDNRQLTVIAAEIERQKLILEGIQKNHDSLSGDIAANKVRHTIGVLESLLSKQEKYHRTLIDETWKHVYEDEQVPSAETQNYIILLANETFKQG